MWDQSSALPKELFCQEAFGKEYPWKRETQKECIHFASLLGSSINYVFGAGALQIAMDGKLHTSYRDFTCFPTAKNKQTNKKTEFYIQSN